MIPTTPGPGDIPAGPERPEPIRASPPPATALWDQLDALERKVRELEDRLKGMEARVNALEQRRE